MKILLVEDNEAEANLVREVIEERTLGTISVVENGEDALLFLKRQGKYSNVEVPDYVLLDLNLPKVDGRQVLREAKTNKNIRRIPIIVLTSSDADRDVMEAYELSANCYIRKPTDFNEFVIALETLSYFWTNVVRLPPTIDMDVV